MICDNCKQRPVSVVIKQMQNGVTTERHLCEVCASHSSSIQVDYSNDPLSLNQFLSHFFGTGAFQSTAPKQQQAITCENCGMTFREFLNRGKFGCSHCYESFSEQLPQVFKRLHNGNVKHVGKVPASFNATYALKRKIEDFRHQLKTAIEEERFEDAAKFRDEVRLLEHQLHNGGEGKDVN
jgi:protein arginine kinase activator